MADTSIVEAYTSYSLSQHSSPPGNFSIIFGFVLIAKKFQKKGLQAKPLFVETQVETFNLKSELVDYLEPVRNMTTGLTCSYEQEVVLDSEDEEMHDSQVVTVPKGLWDEETDRTVKIPLLKFQKRQFEPPSTSKQSEERAPNSSATTFGKSVAGNKGAAIDAESSDDKHHLHLPTRLNQVPSPELGELTQANALSYVDHYLSFNNVELSPGICHRKGTREKSPPVLSARGPRGLARKVQVWRTHHEEKGPFEWVDSDQNDRGAGIFNIKIEASSNFGVCGQTYVRRQKKGNRCEEKLVQGPGAVAENNNSILDVQSDATRENVEAYSGVTHTEDMSDIGLNTQIAAEAMEALAYVPPPENRLTMIKDQSSNHRKRNNNVMKGGIPRYKRKKSGLPPPESRLTRIKDQSSNHRKRNNNVMEGGVLRCKRKRSGSVADPFKLVGEAKHIRLPFSSCLVDRKSRLNCQVQVSPQLSTSSSFLRLNSWHCPKGPRGKRKCRNMQSHPDEHTSLFTQSIIVNGKESDTPSNRSQRVVEGQDNAKISCFPHTHPLCNDSCIDTGRCLFLGNSVNPGSAGDDMQYKTLHDARPLLLAHVAISSKKSISKSGFSSSEGIKVSNADFTYYKHHKKPCDKNLPKSSLLKELIRLGVSKSTPDLIGKDLRQRRDMTDVRVLFSQHLDDSIVKQQKKVLARMNISIASCSMEATHFVADKFTRTKNMLESIALGKLVVTHLWLDSCGQANCFIDEKNYILRDVKKEKEIGFSMPVSLARARQQPLLKGTRVFITPHIKPDNKVITSLVTAVHGHVVDECQIYAGKNDKILHDLLILSCEEDYAICRPFLERGIAVYGSELLLNGIVIQKLEFGRHQLFMKHVARTNPSTWSRFGKVYRRRRDQYLENS